MSAVDRPLDRSDLGPHEWERFRSWATAFGVPLSERELRLLQILLEELWAWNRKMNLTGLATRERILKELILDSVIAHGRLPDTSRLLDVGTGAGFPGIPIKICRPGLILHLVESGSKKVGFLRHVIRRAGLEGAEVFQARIEAAGPLLDVEGYPMITARAVAPLHRIIPWCAPHLSDGGLLVGFQGNRAPEALEEARGAMKRHGLKPVDVIPYSLPGKGSPRHIVLLQKAAAGGEEPANR